MIKRFLRAAVCSVVFALCVIGGLRPNGEARAQSITEFEVKAALIYNFAQFVNWPDRVFSGPNDPFLICVLSEKASSRVMEKTFEGKSVRGRQIRIEQSDNLQELKKCQILFVSMAMKDRMSEIMDAIGSAAVLTIGDMENFAQSGAPRAGNAEARRATGHRGRQ